MPILALARKLRDLFGRTARDESFFEELEDVLVEGDLGVRVVRELVEQLREAAAKDALRDREEMTALMRERLAGLILTDPPDPKPGTLNVLLVLGVNGVGKTTTIAKLARYYGRSLGMEAIVLAAADTFRAAAIDQLVAWGERLGARVVRQSQGSDAGAVLYDALSSASSRGAALVIADTAGRLHTKTNLVKELEKLDKIVRAKSHDGVYRKLLVIDATTGQNALRQAEVFHEAVGVDGVVLAKYDSTAKGGVVVSISSQLGIPMAFVGTGEKPEDLAPFDTGLFLDALLGPVSGRELGA